jgi:hypothetical protein
VQKRGTGVQFGNLKYRFFMHHTLCTLYSLIQVGTPTNSSIGWTAVGPVWTLGVNIYPKENDLPLPFAPTNICPLGCLDGVANMDVDERGRAGPTTNLLQFATF